MAQHLIKVKSFSGGRVFVTSFGVMTGVITLYAREAPRADPHAGCCGGWGLETPGYPIMFHFLRAS